MKYFTAIITAATLGFAAPASAQDIPGFDALLSQVQASCLVAPSTCQATVDSAVAQILAGGYTPAQNNAAAARLIGAVLSSANESGGAAPAYAQSIRDIKVLITDPAQEDAVDVLAANMDSGVLPGSDDVVATAGSPS